MTRKIEELPSEVLAHLEWTPELVSSCTWSADFTQKVLNTIPSADRMAWWREHGEAIKATQAGPRSLNPGWGMTATPAPDQGRRRR